MFNKHDPYKITNLRPILIAPVKDKERVRLAEEILFVQLVGTELHGRYVLGKQNSSYIL